MADWWNGLYAGASAVQGITEIASSVSEAFALSEQGAFQKQQLEFNAQLAQLNARDAIERGEAAVTKRRKATKQLIGAQRAALAASGVVVDSGSAAEIQMDTVIQSAQKVNEIRNDAWREAWGYNVQAADYRMQGMLAEKAAQTKMISTFITGGMRGLNYFSESARYAGKFYQDNYNRTPASNNEPHPYEPKEY